MPRNILPTNPKKSEAAKKRWANPEYIKKQKETHLGFIPSDEQRKKQSEFMKTRPSPMDGKHHTEESKRKNREAHLGKPSPKKGIPLSEDQKEKQRIAMKDKIQTEEHKQKNREANLGEKNHNFGKPLLAETKKKLSATKQGIPLNDWEGFATPINRYVRNSPKYKKACEEAILDAEFRDYFTGEGGLLECHHKIPHNLIMRLNNITTKEQADACDLLFDKHNLIVILKSAHDKFHNLYGDDKNIYELTEEQIQELYQQ